MASAQVIPYKPRKSQIALAVYQTPEAYVKVNYGQPLRRDRPIFGDLVPYGVLWRTGANEATEITTTAPLRFGEEVLPAGIYSVYSIPQLDTWTIIFNRTLGSWGDYGYDSAHDVLRVRAASTQIPETYEAFTIKILEGDPTPRMELLWDRTAVTLPFEVVKAP